MKQIIIYGKSGDYNAVASECDDIECPDDFVEYIDNEVLRKKLYSGYMTFENRQGVLYTITTYDVKEGQILTEKEIEELKDYTQGQWSDGIGEGFEQFSYKEIDGEEIYISPWYHGQKIFAEIK
ncbi:MAG: hypothetical protein RLZ10_2165 [Bacteroidota bacterium]|jgi:hypothetical protein